MILHTQSPQPIPPPIWVAKEELKRPWALRDLPPFPAIATRLLAVLAKEDCGLREVSNLITQDMAFAAEVLRMANSSLFGLQSEISSILQGVAFLGTERVKGMAFTVAIRGHLRHALTHDILRRCWRHSLACALVAEEMSVRLFLDGSRGYTAGLMHDIGRLALLAAYPKQYVELFEAAQENSFDVREGERAMFDVDHCEAGCWLVKSWGLPHEFEEYTGSHHEKIGSQKMGMTSVTQAGCAIANAMGFSVVQSEAPLSPAEVCAQLPEWERGRFHPAWDDLAFRVAAKVNAMEY